MPDLLRHSASNSLLFKGRPGDLRLGEWVKLIDAIQPDNSKEQIVILGCPDDLGVVRNKGRAGAKEGPDSIRKHLYKMTPPMDQKWEKNIDLLDIGNVIVDDTDIQKTHERTREIVRYLAQNKSTVICLGGGHDFAAPNFLGLVEGTKGKNTRFGLISMDPHLDMRELENGLPHSGTPFRVILDSGKLLGSRLISLGVRSNRNSRDNYQYAKSHGVRMIRMEEMDEPKAIFEKEIKRLTSKCDVAALTIDMDSCKDAEGSSAAPVFGFSASDLIHAARLAGSNKKIRLLEVAEVSPALDPAERSSRIAAEVIFAFLEARARSLN